eukprot:14737330-Alexandrium_andersonii.AAC.1
MCIRDRPQTDPSFGRGDMPKPSANPPRPRLGAAKDSGFDPTEAKSRTLPRIQRGSGSTLKT